MLRLVMPAKLIESDDQSLGLDAAIVPRELDARRTDA